MKKKYFSINIDGDELSSNKYYSQLLSDIVDWTPEKDIMIWCDKFLPNYKKVIYIGKCKVELYYPRDFKELTIYIILKFRYRIYPNDCIANRDFKLLEAVLTDYNNNN